MSGDSTCEDEAVKRHNKDGVLKYKFVALAIILVAGGIGVSLPQLGSKISALNPENISFS